jgi:hypothetical protein
MKAKKKKKGKEKEAAVDTSNHAKVGPNELVRKFDNFYDDYNSRWANLDENDNPNQGYDKGMIR